MGGISIRNSGYRVYTWQTTIVRSFIERGRHLHEEHSAARRRGPRGRGNPRVAGLAGLRARAGRQGPGHPSPGGPSRPRAPVRRQRALHVRHALHQHHFRTRAGAVSGRPGDRAAHQEPRALERAGHGRARQPRVGRHRRPHLDVRLVGDALRGGVQSFLPRQGRRGQRRHHLLPGARGAGAVLARVPGRPAIGGSTAQLPARAAYGRRAVLLSAPVADAGLLGVSDGVHGPRPVDVDLPGALRPVPREPRAQAAVRPEGLGVPGRRRDGRAGDARRHLARLPREAR